MVLRPHLASTVPAPARLLLQPPSEFHGPHQRIPGSTGSRHPTSSGRRVLGGAGPPFHQPPSQTREIHQNTHRNSASAPRAFSRHSFQIPVTSVARAVAAAVFPTSSTNHF
ncbi:uncharacterized protein TrAtP1_013029 [Trichoderma atroviride]|uniref:uncharacterized protein n=1 Tax=Hypocrea atroviridis TaxID=63577 RepID=UPI00331A82E4|nr:hypothetical protein TrAtP1_013029 [Trichoderma atroviride]